MTGIPRHLLPQIPSDQYAEFQDFVVGNGVPMKLAFVPLDKLKPIQAHVNREKIESLKNNPEKLANPIIINKDGLILDGHHRFLAAKELNPTGHIPALVAQCGLKKLIELGHEFNGSFTRTVTETTIYSNGILEGDESDALMVRKTLNPWSDKLEQLRIRRGEKK